MKDQIFMTKALGTMDATEIYLVPTSEIQIDHDKLKQEARRLAVAFSSSLPSLTFDTLIQEMLKVGSTKTLKCVCPICEGEGIAEYVVGRYGDGSNKTEVAKCNRCNGVGIIWIDDDREEVEE